MPYLLPQNDPSPTRQALVANNRAKWTVNFANQFPMCNYVQSTDDQCGPQFFVNLTSALANNRANVRLTVANSGFTFTKPLPGASVTDLAALLVKQDVGVMTQYFMCDLGPIVPSGRPTSVDDYVKFFNKPPGAPATYKYLYSDAWFANAYVAGSDPDVLQRMTQPLANFPIADAHMQTVPALAGDSVSAAMASGRLYYVDYSILAGLTPGQHPQQPKFLYAPLAAFAVPLTGGPMVPFAIQLGPDPAGRPIFTPADSWSWRIACTMTQAATNNHSASVSHLAQTHLLIEPIAVSLHKNMAPNHPLYVLLHRHILNTLVVNDNAFKVLVNQGQYLDRMVGTSSASTFALVEKCRLGFDFKARTLPNRLLANNTADATALPYYPYRDDGMLVWAAIHRWITAYVNLYYADDSVVLADSELQIWASDIGPNGWGKVQNFGNNRGFDGKADLIDALTMVIFTAGPQHAAINFAQSSDMTFLPVAPMAGYAPEIMTKNNGPADWLNVLPPLDVQGIQLTLTSTLGGVYYSKLGDYNNLDAIAQPALAAYNAELARIEVTINAANQERPFPYLHLLPSKIPQSTNI